MRLFLKIFEPYQLAEIGQCMGRLSVWEYWARRCELSARVLGFRMGDCNRRFTDEALESESAQVALREVRVFMDEQAMTVNDLSDDAKDMIGELARLGHAALLYEVEKKQEVLARQAEGCEQR